MPTQVIWLRAETTEYTALCEACDDERRYAPRSEVVELVTIVQGTLRPDADVGFTTCRRGHRIRVRRIERVHALATG